MPDLGQHDQALNGEKVAVFAEPYHSVSARACKASSPRRSAPQAHVGCSRLSPLQKPAEQDEVTEATRT